MPKRITKLTEAQKARFDEWADRWIEIGLRTGDADRPRFEAAVRECYRFAGLEPPKVIVWTTSPLAVSLAGSAAALLIELAKAPKVLSRKIVRDAVRDAVGGAVGGAVRDAVRGAVRGAVGGAVRDAVRDAVGGAVGDAVGGAVGDAVGGAVRDAVRGAVRDAVRDAVGGAVHDAVGGAVGDAVRDAVGDAVRDAVGDAVLEVIRRVWSNNFGGQFWVGGWYWGGSWTSFFRDVCELELNGDLWDRARAYEATLESACWWYPHRDFVIVSERPAAIHRELADPSRPRGWNSHRLHRENGAAVSFRDGWGVWAWHGARVSRQIIEAPETLTTEQIAAEENAEVRRTMIERVGWDRFCELAKMRLIHLDELHSRFPAVPISETVEPGSRLIVGYREGSERAELLEADGITDFEDRPLRFVRLTDPSTGRQYTIRVRHDHTRCYEAVAWTFGLDETEYKRGRYLRQGDVFLKPLAGGPIYQQHS